MITVPLSELATVIRSKNAGPFLLTFDVLFENKENFIAVCESGTFNIENIASIFQVDTDSIKSIHTMPTGNAIKFTLQRPIPQGSIGESDMYGCQQHSPLLDLPVKVQGG